MSPERPTIQILFDGGSLGNPGPGYGSYTYQLPDGTLGLIDVDFQRRMTGNEAEYQTLIEALEFVLEILRRRGDDPARYTVEIRGDSDLVLSQVSGAWKARNPRMRRLRNRVRELLGRFGYYRLIHVPRAVVLHSLGH